MKYTAEFNWLESYLDNDTLWLDDVVNWDETFDLVLSDYNIFSFLTTAFFYNNHVFLDFFTKLSFLDLIFINKTDKLDESSELLSFFMYDVVSFLSTSFLTLQILFFTDYQDFILVILHHSPELSLALCDYVSTYWLSSTSYVTPSAVFDVFSDSLNFSLSEFMEYFVAFLMFVWNVILFIGICRITKWNNPLEVYMVRIQNYVYCISRETRLQYEVALKIFFFIVFYTTMMIATFDDDQEELLEFFNGLLFYFFLSLFVYFIYKYSIHYLSFLEASVGEGRTLGFALKQFSRDITNNVAFLLRFLVLMLRLNIYDTVDDIFDSYYIFVGDFDDDEYFSDLFFPIFSVMFFDTDVNDDRSFFFEDEVDFSNDLFSLYFIMWGKFTFFVFFILEEIVRVALAFYVTYLILFEIHAINRSYVEDTYFGTKRSLTTLKEKSYV